MAKRVPTNCGPANSPPLRYRLLFFTGLNTIKCYNGGLPPVPNLYRTWHRGRCGPLRPRTGVPPPHLVSVCHKLFPLSSVGGGVLTNHFPEGGPASCSQRIPARHTEPSALLPTPTGKSATQSKLASAFYLLIWPQKKLANCSVVRKGMEPINPPSNKCTCPKAAHGWADPRGRSKVPIRSTPP